VSTAFSLILACWRSGQMSETQLETHLADPLFAAWWARHA
jgi:hypothetical protein